MTVSSSAPVASASSRRAARIRALRPTMLASIILVGGYSVVGEWGGARIEEAIIQRAAAATALAMNGLVQQLAQGLAGPAPSEADRAGLSAAIARHAPGHDFTAVRIWSPAHTLLYSSRPDTIGRTIANLDGLRQALNGLVSAEFVPADEAASQGPSLGGMLLNVLAPVRDAGGQAIVAVVEYNERDDALRAKVQSLWWQIRLAVVASAIVTVALLFVAATRSARGALAAQAPRLAGLSVEIRALHERLRIAYRLASAANEALMRRISAELHDAPAQSIGFALLRLDALRPHRPAGRPTSVSEGEALQLAEQPQLFDSIRGALADSLHEIRAISAGLAAPELAGLSLAEALDLAATRHARRTGTAVSRDLAGLPNVESSDLKLCAYRFVQEGLNNAFRHAGGRGQALLARFDGAILEIVVADDGPGFSDLARTLGLAGGQGLIGLRLRIEALGGTLDVQSSSGRGARLTARFDLSQRELEYA